MDCLRGCGSREPPRIEGRIHALPPHPGNSVPGLLSLPRVVSSDGTVACEPSVRHSLARRRGFTPSVPAERVSSFRYEVCLPPRKSAAQARRAPGLHGAMLRSGKQARRANLTAQLRRFCFRRHLLSRCADEEAIDIRRESFMPSLADYAGFIPADDAKTQPSSLGRSRHRPGRSPCGGRSRSG